MVKRWRPGRGGCRCSHPMRLERDSWRQVARSERDPPGGAKKSGAKKTSKLLCLCMHVRACVRLCVGTLVLFLQVSPGGGGEGVDAYPQLREGMGFRTPQTQCLRDRVGLDGKTRSLPLPSK